VLTTAGPIAAKTITYTPQQVYYRRLMRRNLMLA